MAKIELGRYSELLRRALGMKGVVEVASELSPEVSATWQLEGDSAEWQFLKGVRLISSSLTAPGAAGLTGRFHLVNPADSGVIATVFPVEFNAIADTNFVIRMVGTALANLTTVGTSVPRDNRWTLPATGASPVILSSEAGAGSINAGFLVHIGDLLSRTNYTLPVPVILTPGSSLQWGALTGNVGVAGSAHWAERQLPELEA